MTRPELNHHQRPIRSSGQLLRYAGIANQLIVSAADAVRTFYVNQLDGPDGVKPFEGFIRDSLHDSSDNPFSTGGAAVTADLWEIGPLVSSLISIDADKVLDKLLTCRDKATSHVASTKHPLKLRATFGAPNVLTASHVAYQLTRTKPLTKRGLVFNALAFQGSCDSWPALENAEAHPFVAYDALRALEGFFQSGQNVSSLLAAAKEPGLFASANVEPVDNIGKAFADALLKLEAIKLDLPAIRHNYGEKARLYLREQHSHATVHGRSPTSTTLDYDPVGACFALDILANSAATTDTSDSHTFLRHLGEHAELIFSSTKHVLDAMTPNGSMAWGLPFSYEVRGTGAFATSIAGLAALARVLNRMFLESRRSFYPNAEFLEWITNDNSELLDRLFRLPAKLHSTAVEVQHATLEKVLKGWSTDRAPSRQRIESWVTVDVLLFGLYVRFLIQEVAQFGAITKYGAGRPGGAVPWPYDPRDNPKEPLPDTLQDPDEDSANPVNNLAPVQVLHQTFRHLMGQGSSDWKNEKASFLLFGPPGTAKTTIVKALADALRWHYLELTPSNFIEDGLELIEKRAKEIFEDLGVLRETVIFFDELDSLLVEREVLDSSSILNFSVPAMLPKLQQLNKSAKKQRLLVVFATNFYDRLDAAVVRRGRVDERFVVLPHNGEARRRFFLGRGLAGPDLEQAVSNTPLAVYEDLDRYASELKSKKRKPADPIAGIGPTLYFSRIPNAERQQVAVRSTERLAIEVCEVIGRLLGQPRHLAPDADRGQILTRLNALRKELNKVTGLANQAAWGSLCDRLLTALTT
jgi:hypothetical protein